MFRRIVAFLLAFVMIIPTAVTVRADEPGGLPVFDFDFETVYENEHAALLLDTRNNNIRVFQKDSGAYFDTLVMNGQAGNLVTRNVQRSDFHLELFRDTFAGTRMHLDSFSESVLNEQVTYTPIPGGVSARFRLGDPDRIQLTMFPMFIERDRLEYFVLQHMTQMERDDFTQNFYRFVGGRFVRAWPTIESATGNPYPIPIPRLRRLNEAFYTIGTYCFDELNYDNMAWEQPEFTPAPLVYVVVEYTLCGPDLVVTVPRSGMEFQEHQPYSSIALHPYFLSGSVYDEGYIVVPDGSGGIIMFNNGMTTQEAVIPIFGRDPLYSSFSFHEPFLQATLPIFGVVRNDTAILAIIEEGAPVATIHANTSGRIDEFNRVFARFELLYHETQIMRGQSLAATSNRFMDEIYDMDIRQRYIFLTGDDANYLGMARAYQAYLLERGLLNSVPQPENAPFFVDFIAATPRSRSFMGILYTQQFPMTTAEDAQNILQSMTNNGIANIHAQYSHWANGGMFATRLDNVRPLRSIGGRRGMRDLEQFTVDHGIELYPTANVVSFRVTPGRLGRTNYGMLTRSINNSRVAVPWHYIAERTAAAFVTLLSPSNWVNYIGRVVNNFRSLGFRNIAATDIGGMLFGDYGRRNQVTRLEALDYMEDALDALSRDIGLMLLNPNAYAFAFADVITDLPFQPGGRRIVDFNIPLVQMVLDGHIPHSMPAFNLDPMAWRGFDEYLLRAVEGRSGMKLILTQESEREFFPTFQVFGARVLPHMFFQTEYRQWESRIADYYARFNEFYQQVRGAEMTAHTVLELGTHVIVEYSNGVVVYINYCDNPWEIDGRVIAPLSFEVV